MGDSAHNTIDVIVKVNELSPSSELSHRHEHHLSALKGDNLSSLSNKYLFYSRNAPIRMQPFSREELKHYNNTIGHYTGMLLPVV